MDTEEWMTVQEVADLFRVHPETVRRWVSAGRLPVLDLGRGSGFRIRRADVDAFARERFGYLGNRGDSPAE